MKSSVAAAAVRILALAVLIPGTVFAGGPDFQGEQKSVAVRYSDLDLARPGGAAKLYRRIRTAADQVCGPRTLTGSIAESPSYRKCVDAAVEQAVAGVNQRALTAWYGQHARGRSSAG